MEQKQTRHLTADVVIVGGGASGLPAAIAARRGGAEKVLLLEKGEQLGGNGRMAHALFAVDSRAQLEQNIHYSADQMFSDRMDESEWTIDPVLTRDLINKAKDVVQWLEDRGMMCDYVFAMSGSESFENSADAPKVFHCLNAPTDQERALGPVMIPRLEQECRELGVEIMTGTAGRELLLDDMGRVRGLIAERDGQDIRVDAPNVILASGGFAENQDLLNRYMTVPVAEGELFFNGLPQMTGDGLMMAQQVDALDRQASVGLIGPCHYPWAMSLNLMVRRPHVLMVNRDGERFIGYPRKGTSNALSRQPGKICYAVFDQAILRETLEKRESMGGGEEEMGDHGAWFDHLADDLKAENGTVSACIADTLDELAAYMGADPAVLKATVARYNELCDRGYDADYLKDPVYMLPLREAPYYAVLGRQAVDSTMGGIRIDHEMQVVNGAGQRVEGLYATGDAAGGFLSIAYKYPGQALTFALYSGLVSGGKAAERAAKK